MFAPDSSEDVMLGIPVHSSDPATATSTATCYTSKVGGAPLWMTDRAGRDRVGGGDGDSALLKCGKCQKTLMFVMQIYAPTDDLERALYMFCCPSSCATQSEGWRVMKDQYVKGSGGKGIEKESSQVTVEVTTDDSLKTDWVGLCAPAATQAGASKSGGFTFDDDSDDDDLSSLAALIDARDDALKSKNVSTDTSSNTAKSISAETDATKFPPPPPAETAGKTSAPIISMMMETETLLTEVYESECTQSRSAQSNHVDDLFQKYLDETITNGEEDPHIISLLQEQQQRRKVKNTKKTTSLNEDSDDDFEDKDDEEFNNSIRQMQGTRRAMAIQQKQSDELRQEKAKDAMGSSQGSMSKRDWARRQKSEEYFQKRFSAAPSQVMRYAYGGEPMWCFLPAPSTDSKSVPPCAKCKSSRVFELQIMPAVIGYVEAALAKSSEIDNTASTHPVPRTPLDLGSGFDFGVVSVWSCPNSCSESSYEVAVAQPPSDLA